MSEETNVSPAQTDWPRFAKWYLGDMTPAEEEAYKRDFEASTGVPWPGSKRDGTTPGTTPGGKATCSACSAASAWAWAWAWRHCEAAA